MRARHDPAILRAAAADTVKSLLANQAGIILRQQALAAGITVARFDQWVRSRRLRRVYPSVYTTRDPDDPDARLWAAWLWAGDGAVLGGGAALYWRGVLTGPPGVLTVYVPRARSRVSPRGLRVIRGRLDPRDVMLHRGIRITSPARTCLDLARWGQPHDYLEVILRRELATPAIIAAALRRCAAMQGYDLAFAAAGQVARTPWSHPERSLHVLLDDAEITGWVANAAVRTPIGEIRPDIAFPDVKLAVEINGKRYHDEAVDPRAFERDHRREKALVDAGWLVIRFTAKQIERDPHGVLRTIRQVLARLRGVAA